MKLFRTTMALLSVVAVSFSWLSAEVVIPSTSLPVPEMAVVAVEASAEVVAVEASAEVVAPVKVVEKVKKTWTSALVEEESRDKQLQRLIRTICGKGFVYTDLRMIDGADKFASLTRKAKLKKSTARKILDRRLLLAKGSEHIQNDSNAMLLVDRLIELMAPEQIEKGLDEARAMADTPQLAEAYVNKISRLMGLRRKIQDPEMRESVSRSMMADVAKVLQSTNPLLKSKAKRFKTMDGRDVTTASRSALQLLKDGLTPAFQLLSDAYEAGEWGKLLESLVAHQGDLQDSGKLFVATIWLNKAIKNGGDAVTQEHRDLFLAWLDGLGATTSLYGPIDALKEVSNDFLPSELRDVEGNAVKRAVIKAHRTLKKAKRSIQMAKPDALTPVASPERPIRPAGLGT